MDVKDGHVVHGVNSALREIVCGHVPPVTFIFGVELRGDVCVVESGVGEGGDDGGEARDDSSGAGLELDERKAWFGSVFEHEHLAVDSERVQRGLGEPGQRSHRGEVTAGDIHDCHGSGAGPEPLLGYQE